jgi:hypothetical protein
MTSEGRWSILEQGGEECFVNSNIAQKQGQINYGQDKGLFEKNTVDVLALFSGLNSN